MQDSFVTFSATKYLTIVYVGPGASIIFKIHSKYFVNRLNRINILLKAVFSSVLSTTASVSKTLLCQCD